MKNKVEVDVFTKQRNAIISINQGNYKTKNVYFSQKQVELSSNEKYFNEYMIKELERCFTRVKNNMKNLSYWNEALGAAVSMILIIKGDSLAQAGGAAMGAASLKSVVDKDVEYNLFKQSSEAFFRLLDAKDQKFFNVSLSSHHCYRFSNLINILEIESVKAFAELLIKQILASFLENKCEFESQDQLLFYYLDKALPDETSDVYKEWFVCEKKFAVNINGKKDTLSIRSCFFDSSASMESGSLYLRTNTPDVFEYPLQKLGSEEEAVRQGFTKYLDVPKAWNLVCLANPAENQKNLFLTDLMKFSPGFHKDLYSVYQQSSELITKLGNMQQITQSALDKVYISLFKYTVLMCKVSSNDLTSYNNVGLERITENLTSGKTDAIQILLLFQLTIAKISEYEAIAKKYINNHPELGNKLIELDKWKGVLENALTHLSIAHNCAIQSNTDIQTLLKKCSSENTPMRREIIQPDDGISDIRNEIKLEPNEFNFAQIIDPRNIDRNANNILDYLNIKNNNFRLLLKAGTCVISFALGGLSIGYTAVISAVGCMINNFLGGLVERDRQHQVNYPRDTNYKANTDHLKKPKHKDDSQQKTLKQLLDSMKEKNLNSKFKVTLANEGNITIELIENNYTEELGKPAIDEKLTELTTAFAKEIDKLELSNCNISKDLDSRVLTVRPKIQEVDKIKPILYKAGKAHWETKNAFAFFTENKTIISDENNSIECIIS